jgi:hypothetical protein
MTRGIGFAFILILLAASAFGQDTVWTRNYGFNGTSEQGMSGCLTSDGGFAMAGYTTSISGGDAWIVRGDQNGDTLWTRHYGGDRWQEPHFIAETSDGGLILTGKFNVAVGDYEVGVIKLAANGDSLWGNLFGVAGVQDGGNMVIELSDGNFLAVGEGRNAGTTDLYMVKFDSLGNFIWERFHGSTGSDYAYGVVELADGGFAVTGTFSTTSGSSDIWLVRTDSMGISQWGRRYDFHDGLDRGDAIVQTPNGDFVIGGRTWNGTYAQLVGLRVDSLGNQIWASEFGSLSDGEFAESIDMTADGGFVIGGGKGFTTFDFYVVRLSSAGDSLWAARYNGATNRSDDCYEIRVDNNNNILAFGYTDINTAAPSDLQFWLVKIHDDAFQPGNPDIDVSPISFDDTVQVGQEVSIPLYISNLGNADLIYSAEHDSAWVSVAPDSGAVTMTETDTVQVTLSALTLTEGTYSANIIVNSNDPDEASLTLPVTLVVIQEASGCVYIPGDINGNGSTNGIDVTFGVQYFKGGSVPPIDCNPPCIDVPEPFYAAGDVNGNCAFNGLDITFFVAYLKGLQPALLWCTSCPPATGR